MEEPASETDAQPNPESEKAEEVTTTEIATKHSEPKEPVVEEKPTVEEPTIALPPKVYFDNITSDNIININESQMTLQVTGRVENIQDQSLIHLHIGNAIYEGKVAEGKFSIEVDGKTLAVHKQIQASLSTDKSDKTVGEHKYEVDVAIEQPEICLLYTSPSPRD